MRRRILAIAGAVCMVITAATARAQVTLSDTPLWKIDAGDPNYPFIANDNNSRSIAYNPVTGNLLVPSRSGGNGVYVLNGQTGALVGSFNVEGITGGTFALNHIGVAGDGAIYIGNLTTNAASDTNPFKLYRWASESAALTSGGNTAPTQVYSGDPTAGGGGTNPRFGDSMSVVGSGAATQILIGARAPLSTDTTRTLYGKLIPTDATGSAFSAQAISADHNGGNLGLAFEDPNTFWTKAPSMPLRRVTISDDQATTVNSVGGFVPTTAGLGVNGADNVLGLIKYQSSTSAGTNISLYDITDPAAPLLVGTRDFAVSNTNGNAVGDVEFGNGVMYALATNSGLVAYRYQIPEPGSLALAGLGALGLLARRRRLA